MLAVVKPIVSSMSVHGDAAAEAPSPRTTETGISRVTSLSDLARPRVRNRSALLVGFAVAVALFTLVAAAFSVAAESRVVASKSNQLHSYDEVLRCAITVRSQLGSALNFAQLDASQNTDSSVIIGSALTDASGCITELQNSTGLEAGSDRAVEARLAFSTSSARVSELLVGGGEEDLVAARDLLIGPMNSEYEELIGALVDERQDLVDDLRQADENLGRLGALATFIIAFFVPTVAMFVYRQITRRQRETIELARLLSEARTGAEWRAELVRGAVRLANEETESLPVSPLTSSLGTRLRDLEFLLGSTTSGPGILLRIVDGGGGAQRDQGVVAEDRLGRRGWFGPSLGGPLGDSSARQRHRAERVASRAPNVYRSAVDWTPTVSGLRSRTTAGS